MNRLLLIAEDQSDARVLAFLVDRVLGETAAASRVYCAIDGRTEAAHGLAFSKWTDLKHNDRKHRISVRGRFGREGSMEKELRKALALADRLGTNAAGVIFHRDTDGDASRLAQYERVAADVSTPLCPAVPIPMMEAWFIVGFVPETDEEQQRLQALRPSIGFDPTQKPGRMKCGKRKGSYGEPRLDHAKNILDHLTDDEVRKRKCLDALPLDSLGPPHDEAQLTHFVERVRSRLAPFFED